MADATRPIAQGNTPSAQAPYVLALDVGSSSTRAILFDATGNAVPHVKAQTTYSAHSDASGESSFDADALVEQVALTIDEALAAAGPLAQQIAAVAIDTFWHSLVAVDASGRPLMPVLTWADTRAQDAADTLRRELDERALHERTGAGLHASYWPAKLRWLAQTQPQVASRAAQYLSFGEFLHRQIVGRSVCSLSMASGTGLLVTRSGRWATDLLPTLGVHREQLPNLGDLRDSVRGLTPAYAQRWPALRDARWFPAFGDGATANVGSGCMSPGQVAITVGTSSAVRAVVPNSGDVAPDGLWLYLVDARRALLGGALSEGGNLFAWMEQTLRVPPLAEAEAQMTALAPDGHGLTILPFVAGERSLGWHGAARATISGMHTHTTPFELLRAGVEALAYRISAVYTRLAQTLAREGAPDHGGAAPLLVASGGALLGSPLFQQIVADSLGVPLHPSREHEASARGAALLALEALGILSEAATAAPQLGAPVLPDAARGAIYQRGAARQAALYHKLLDESAV